jgi:16S rRNA (guanine527-N7)-methyltransferase
VAPRDLRTRLGRRAAKAGIFVPDDLAAKLIVYYELLSRWNRKINLTALDDVDAAIDRLLLEPIMASRYVPTGAAAIMDVGSGGGSPAIPLKLAVPSAALTMVEAKARKSAFLREAVRQLDLEDASVETSRYEELLTRPELLEHFDVVSLRAVRVEARALATLQAFVRPGGVFFLFRGPGGTAAPSATLVPPLVWVGTHPLVETLQSRLTLVRKAAVRFDAVPRGTA